MLEGLSIFKLHNLLSAGLITKWRLSPSSRKVVTEKKKIFKIMIDFYNKRRMSGKHDGVNILDLMIRHNQKVEAGEISQDEYLDDERVVDIMRAFYFAGYETSMTQSAIGLYYLSVNYDFLENFFGKDVDLLNQKDPKERNYDDAKNMEIFVKETLRLFGPLNVTLPRYCTKTCKIGKYKIYKGSLVSVRMDLLRTDPSIYENPYNFLPRRFSDKNMADKATRNLSNIPFYAGRRSCIGQYLGEVLVKIVLRSVLTSFEICRDIDSRPVFGNLTVVDLAKAGLNLKPLVKDGPDAGYKIMRRCALTTE